MNVDTSGETRSRIHPDTRVAELQLTISDLERSVQFYTDLIGLQMIERDAERALFGVSGMPILTVREAPGARPWPRGGRSYAGLYHFAILMPTRADLGRWLQHWIDSGNSVPGQGDHFVSEALYLEDPDGHGIEIYRDRPRSEWEWQDGQVRMGVDPVDIHGVLEEGARDGQTWSGMPEGTTLGHIHLQVSDIQETARFYDDLLGFDIAAQMPSALFMSAGGYHHHIGANIWHSRGIGQPPEDMVGLLEYTIDLPGDEALAELQERLDPERVPRDESGRVTDPSGIQIRLRSA